ncbi:hemerythrin domain-containing protein [Actinocatenispora sera]|nr:hemerythrin domain-containing protein [Actinocatenispora sera]
MTTALRASRHETVLAHRAFRRASALLAARIAAVEPGQPRRAAALAGRLRAYQRALRGHQGCQDRLLWPVLLARCDLGADLVLRMRAQHERLAGTLTAIDVALPGWVATTAEDDRDRLVAALVEHHAVLAEHVDEEDRDLLPLAADHLAAHEWQALRAQLLARLRRPRLFTYLGIVLTHADRAERRLVLATLPRRDRLGWYLVGKPWRPRWIRP